jgi:large subunit ribosomal protein L7Ae
LGIEVGSAAATIIDAGEGQHIIDQVVGALASIKDKKE